MRCASIGVCLRDAGGATSPGSPAARTFAASTPASVPRTRAHSPYRVQGAGPGVRCGVAAAAARQSGAVAGVDLYRHYPRAAGAACSGKCRSHRRCAGATSRWSGLGLETSKIYSDPLFPQRMFLRNKSHTKHGQLLCCSCLQQAKQIVPRVRLLCVPKK
jgi:hypothetical protein